MVNFMHFLGFDPAYKSLAWSYMSINIDIVADISAQIELYLAQKNHIDMVLGAINASSVQSVDIDKPDPILDLIESLLRIYYTIETLIEKFVIMHDYNVIDALCGQKISSLSEIERTRYFCAALCGQTTAKIHPEALFPGTTIIIEHQPPKFGRMGTNDVVSVAAHGIVFRYCQGPSNNPIVYIDPKCKNNISIGDITFAKFLAASKSKRKYTARKQHTKAMLIHICNALNINISKVATANLDDLADSFMGVFAHCLRNKILDLAPLLRLKPIIERLVTDINALIDILGRKKVKI
jgi:hypothetical protein